ncbi:unnamed protein product [Didymodactylos carnosus]|uniref:Uncharacterized protein n=1 Tax=Didymodactylos carnosus TaxID=1234261 RepID=A0A815FQ88_9BILA|nr:unnamed protein product [Didymodactylos carnosus]CAF4180783.1 unnamed protein product [Didymodactylos carnosus]
MPKTARLDLLVLKRYYSPHGVRCCSDHLLGTRLSPDYEQIITPSLSFPLLNLSSSSITITSLLVSFYEKDTNKHILKEIPQNKQKQTINHTKDDEVDDNENPEDEQNEEEGQDEQEDDTGSEVTD